MNTKDIDVTTLKFVHTLETDVRWRDLDELNHVNNSVYFTYFEEARMAWWHSTNEPFNLSDGVGPIIVTADCIFLKPILYPAKLQIDVYAGLPGNSSYMIYYEISIKAQPPILAAKGSTKVVWINYKQGKSLPLPEIVRKHIS